MKFRNKETGSILEPQTKSVEDMMLKSNRYEVYVENKKNEEQEPTITVKELKSQLKELGVPFSSSDNKAKLQELLDEALKNKNEKDDKEDEDTQKDNEKNSGDNLTPDENGTPGEDSNPDENGQI